MRNLDIETAKVLLTLNRDVLADASEILEEILLDQLGDQSAWALNLRENELPEKFGKRGPIVHKLWALRNRVNQTAFTADCFPLFEDEPETELIPVSPGNQFQGATGFTALSNALNSLTSQGGGYQC